MSEQDSEVRAMRDWIVSNIVAAAAFPIRIESVNYFDKYQGCYAFLDFCDGVDLFKLWSQGGDEIYVERFPAENTTAKKENPGWVGFVQDFVGLVDSPQFARLYLMRVFEGKGFKVRVPRTRKGW